jgi:hypothetical protein
MNYSNLIDIDKLLVKTQALMEKVYEVRESFGLQPQIDHVGACINYTDLNPMTREFLSETLNLIVDFVYNVTTQDTMLSEFVKTRSKSAAQTNLFQKARKKFRAYADLGSMPQDSEARDLARGQFCELLLFAFLQHYYHAVPVLRKMPLVTNLNIERHGADAIHMATEDDKYVLYIGEAKSVDKQSGNNFRTSLTNAIKDGYLHYNKHRQEIDQYVYEEFVPAELETVIQDYIEGRLNDIEIRIVCLAAYQTQNCNPQKTDRQSILDEIIGTIQDSITDRWKTTLHGGIPSNIVPRFRYIMFPLEELESTISHFVHLLWGATK